MTPGWFAPFARSMRTMVTRGLVRLIDPAVAMQALQIEVLQGEVLNGVEHMEPYGFTAHAHPGAESVNLGVNGKRSHTIVLCVADRRYRMQGLAQGEVAMYTDEGDYILLKRDRIIDILAENEFNVTAAIAKLVSSTKVRHETPLTEMTGDLEVAENLEVGGDALIAGNVGISGDALIESDAEIDGALDVGGNVNTDSVYQVDGVQVVGPRGSAIANHGSTTGVDNDGTARAKINLILGALRTHGLIAP